MRWISLALLACLLAGPPARAQERTTEGVPLRRDKDRVKMTPPAPEKPVPEKEPEKKTGKESPDKAVEKDPVAAAVARLATWPDADAREAAALLALRGPEIEARLIRRLADTSPAQAAGICFVLGEVGRDASLAAVERLAARPGMVPWFTEIFDALGKLDGANAVSRVLPFLRHPKRRARLAAETWLMSRVNAGHAARLASILTDRSRGARLSAFRLLSRGAPEEARARAFDLLDDPAPELARAAADLISSGADDAAIARLNRMVAGVHPRRSAYAALTLVLVGEKTGRRPFTPETIRLLLGDRGLRAVEKVNRGVAAIALADLGYETDDPAVDAVLDRDVVLTLLDTVGGKTFFKDYNSIAALARNRFGKLTGILDRRPVPELWRWWLEHRDTFRARRVLKTIPAGFTAVFRVRARSVAEPPLPATLFSTRPEDAVGPETAGKGFVYLPETDAAALAARIDRELLSLPDSPRLRGEGGDPDAAITVSLGNRSRTVAGRAGDLEPGLVSVLGELRRLRRTYAWQRYWDRDRYPRHDDFIRTELAFFTGDATEAEKAEHLKAMILSAFDDLTARTEREEALDILRRLPVTFTDSDAYALALFLSRESSLTPVALRIVRVLRKAKRPLVVRLLADWFERHPSPRALSLIQDLLAGLGEREIRNAAGSDRLFLRQAAMRAAPGVLEGDALERVLGAGLKDPAPPVRREALLALGRSGAAFAFARIAGGLEDPVDEVRSAAIEALGRLARPEVVPLLATQLDSKDTGRRVAAVRALCRTGIDEALPPVLLALRRDGSEVVRSVAASEIARLGMKALPGVSRIVMDAKEMPEVRALAVETLVRIGGDHVVDVLRALLQDPDDAVADAAALALAELAKKDAVPRLLAALEAGRNPVRTVAALERLSCQSFPSAKASELPVIYRGWWSERREGREEAWFAEALARRGYPAAPLEGFAAGRREMAAVPVLIRALGDPNWYLRANADLWLRRITLEDFGRIRRYTSEEEVRKIQDRWRSWWEKR